MTYDQAIIRASAHFLTQSLPPESGEWDDRQIDAWLEDHALLGLPWDIADLWDCIDTLAEDYIKLTTK